MLKAPRRRLRWRSAATALSLFPGSWKQSAAFLYRIWGPYTKGALYIYIPKRKSRKNRGKTLKNKAPRILKSPKPLFPEGAWENRQMGLTEVLRSLGAAFINGCFYPCSRKRKALKKIPPGFSGGPGSDGSKTARRLFLVFCIPYFSCLFWYINGSPFSAFAFPAACFYRAEKIPPGHKGRFFPLFQGCLIWPAL